MRTGRPPKPVEVKLREGNAGKRVLPKSTLVGGRSLPRAPAGMSKSERVWFSRLVKLMAGANILDAADFGAVAAAAVALTQASEASLEVERRGSFVESWRGELIPNPGLRVQREAWAMFLRCSERLGLSPSDRARLAGLGISGRPPEGEVEGLGQLRSVS